MRIGSGKSGQNLAWSEHSRSKLRKYTGPSGVILKGRFAICRVYNTDDLIVSFDVVNVQWPNRKDAPANKRWAHQDQGEQYRSSRLMPG
jgi:hypothetical protein